MKRLIMALMAIFCFEVAYSQQVCRADSLRYFEGKVITVCSEVTSTFITKSANKTTFLNFGNFPTQ